MGSKSYPNPLFIVGKKHTRHILFISLKNIPFILIFEFDTLNTAGGTSLSLKKKNTLFLYSSMISTFEYKCPPPHFICQFLKRTDGNTELAIPLIVQA